MSEPLKISVLESFEPDEFEQLKTLIKEFIIETYIKNKPENSELKDKKQLEFINKAISEYEGSIKPFLLTQQDREQLEKDINFQINLAKESLENRINGNTETRYYVMYDEDEMVAFHQAQISRGKEDGRVEGWRNLAYAKPDYRCAGQVLDSNDNLQNDKYNLIIYNDIGRWFEENGVNHEKTCTGTNMLSNINSYIRFMGFLPYNKNDKVIFLEKDVNHKIDIKTLNKAKDLYGQNRSRTEHKTKDEIIEEINNTEEFDGLTIDQKQGLAKCFLKEEEKEFEIPTEKLQMLSTFVEQIYPNYMEEYQQNQEEAIQTLIEKIQSSSMADNLADMGIDTSLEGMTKLIQESIERLQNLKEKSKEEYDIEKQSKQNAKEKIITQDAIGKTTINTPTSNKVEAESKINEHINEIRSNLQNQK